MTKNLDGINCIDYLDKIYQLSLGGLDWKINADWENQDSINFIDYLGGLDCKIKRTESNLNGNNFIDSFGELDWKIDADWENILMVLTLLIISMDLIGKLV